MLTPKTSNIEQPKFAITTRNLWSSFKNKDHWCGVHISGRTSTDVILVFIISASGAIMRLLVMMFERDRVMSISDE